MASQRCLRRLASLSCRESVSVSSVSSRWRPALPLQSRRVLPHHLTRRSMASMSLGQSIAKAIESTGPISLIHYMKQCLTGKDGGYYTSSSDPFGEAGDFVTSPEISQMFGELIGIWVIYEWMSQNQCNGKKVVLIELGPGRGTLMDDALRVMRKFEPFAKVVSGVKLVEASGPLRDLQCAKLCGEDLKPRWQGTNWTETTKHFGASVTWYDDVRQISLQPDEAPFFIAHEFFDALPINAFQNTPDGWRELLVDVKKDKLILPNTEPKEPEFCFTIAPKLSAPARALNSLSPRYEALSGIPNSVVEMSPDSHGYVIHFSKSIHYAGNGAALIIDYGPANTVPVNSLRGIQKHKRVSPFVQPGKVDLSADVDFGALVETALRPDFNVEVHGPAEQSQFLFGLGIKERYESLVQTAGDDPETLAILKSGFERLTERGGLGMGRIYKALAIVPESGGRQVAGFQRETPVEEEEGGEGEGAVAGEKQPQA
ncbi:hypothetical protein TWF718_004397 [Orbilia javanica]|uniref:Protein arginine methyltransferase NDUFAF7 n=1 Tax=Orbilia javanica TaxID=47235 RepID=A0AAN8MXJ9_9PEZI